MHAGMPARNIHYITITTHCISLLWPYSLVESLDNRFGRIFQ